MASCDFCGNSNPNEIEKVAEEDGGSVGAAGTYVRFWLCRDDDACRKRCEKIEDASY